MMDFSQRHGCWVDAEGVDGWMRREARYALDRLKSNLRCQWHAGDAIADNLKGKGRGKRAVHFQLAVKLDANILSGYQNYNNCTAWSTRGGVGCCLAYDIIARGDLHEYKARPGTACIYANRGYRGDDGEALSYGIEAVHQNGIGLEIEYPGYDLSTQKLDEAAGVKWGKSGVPADLAELIKNDLIEQVSEVSDADAVMDIMFGGACIITGSTKTAGGTGDPISPLGPIGGGHAQVMIGYDDTDEFRAWYEETAGKKITDWVAIFDQTWPETACVKITNWPEHLWGPRPPGAFVLAGKDAMKLIDDSGYGQGTAISALAGFQLLNLPDWGAFTVLGE
jgi:hypothetical protein